MILVRIASHNDALHLKLAWRSSDSRLCGDLGTIEILCSTAWCVRCVCCVCVLFCCVFFGVFKNWSTDLRFIRLCTSVDVEVLRAYVIPDLVVCRSKNGLNVVYCLWSYRLLSFFVDREKRTLKLLKGGNRTSEWRKRRRIRKRVCFGNIYEMAVF